MIKCNNLLFRRPTVEDAEQLQVLKNNEKAALLLGGIHHYYSKEDILEWIDFHNNREDEVLLVIWDASVGKLIGHVGLYKIDKVARKTEYGILIADDDSRGKGYGTLATNTMVDYAFNELKMHKVTAELLSENQASISMCMKCGFQIDGTLRDDVFKNGRYYDVLCVSRINPED